MSGVERVSFADAFRAWLYVGLNSFGGPAGQIAVIHREIVERRRWIDERRFLDALNYCMLLPGPEAQQLATNARTADRGRPVRRLHGVRLKVPLLLVLAGSAAAGAAWYLLVLNR